MTSFVSGWVTWVNTKHVTEIGTEQGDGTPLKRAAFSVALRSVAGANDRWIYCDCLMILISYTESNNGIGYIER